MQSKKSSENCKSIVKDYTEGLCIHRAPLACTSGSSAPHRALRGATSCSGSPEQVRVLTLNEDAALINYAQPIVNELRANMVRVEADSSATPIKAKIADAETARVHTMPAR
jgi:threonyl-tRNA synthetase